MPADYPVSIAQVNDVQPVPRRVRAVLGGHTVLDTTSARYVWEWPHYPQYYIPFADIDPSVLVDENHSRRLSRGTGRTFALQVADLRRPRALTLYDQDALPAVAGYVRLEWDALDAWYEEDERVHVHPRNPYTRVDAIRSTRRVRVLLDGIELADSRSPVMVFETGLPTRYYLDPTDVDLTHLQPSDTVTACPYKGVTSGYWSGPGAGTADIAWSYAYPTLSMQAIAGLIAFLNEKVEIELDGRPLVRR
jgi:uncharacterized protein (DUF427 family)